MNRFLLPAIALGLSVLSGCACHVPVPVAVTTPCGPGGCATTPVSQKLTAIGYGNSGSYGQYTSGQAKLMAMRAAKVDAYRNLAEQVQGLRVRGDTAVSAFVAQNDTIRTYVDSFIRGARVVNVMAIADGNYEATVELELTPVFFDCLVSVGHCNGYPVTVGIAPSVVYTSY